MADAAEGVLRAGCDRAFEGARAAPGLWTIALGRMPGRCTKILQALQFCRGCPGTAFGRTGDPCLNHGVLPGLSYPGSECTPEAILCAYIWLDAHFAKGGGGVGIDKYRQRGHEQQRKVAQLADLHNILPFVPHQPISDASGTKQEAQHRQHLQWCQVSQQWNGFLEALV